MGRRGGELRTGGGGQTVWCGNPSEGSWGKERQAIGEKGGQGAERLRSDGFLHQDTQFSENDGRNSTERLAVSPVVTDTEGWGGVAQKSAEPKHRGVSCEPQSWSWNFSKKAKGLDTYSTLSSLGRWVWGIKWLHLEAKRETPYQSRGQSSSPHSLCTSEKLNIISCRKLGVWTHG